LLLHVPIAVLGSLQGALKFEQPVSQAAQTQQAGQELRPKYVWAIIN